MISGGSAGFKMMIAFPRAVPPNTSTADAVVRVNSSMLARVPGPADRDATVATTSAYGTSTVRDTAYTIGITYGPRAAGVKSTARIPASLYRGAFLTWA